jgi:hypothetical protein
VKDRDLSLDADNYGWAVWSDLDITPEEYAMYFGFGDDYSEDEVDEDLLDLYDQMCYIADHGGDA